MLRRERLLLNVMRRTCLPRLRNIGGTWVFATLFWSCWHSGNNGLAGKVRRHYARELQIGVRQKSYPLAGISVVP